MSVNRALVVGGGIGGLTFALAAQENGVQVDVAELYSKVEGVGIMLSGSTLRALDGIGLAEACVERGWPIEHLDVLDGSGQLLAHNPMPVVARAELPPSLGIPRPALAEVLSAAAVKRGARITTGLTIDSLEHLPDGVAVRFSDGREDKYDLLVGADGVYSHVRSLAFPEIPAPSYVGQGAWRFMTPRHPEVTNMMFFQGADRKAGFIPLSDEWMYMLSTKNDPERKRIEADESAAMFRNFLAPIDAPLVQEISARLISADPKTVLWRPFDSLLVPKPWHRERVVLIGDAIHSMTPHLTSGGGMAIEDAVILAELIKLAPDPESALTAFASNRFERVRYIVDTSLEISVEERRPNPSTERMYELTMGGYRALVEPYMPDQSWFAASTSAAI